MKKVKVSKARDCVARIRCHSGHKEYLDNLLISERARLEREDLEKELNKVKGGN